jgi:hypothetical protein
MLEVLNTSSKEDNLGRGSAKALFMMSHAADPSCTHHSLALNEVFNCQKEDVTFPYLDYNKTIALVGMYVKQVQSSSLNTRYNQSRMQKTIRKPHATISQVYGVTEDAALVKSSVEDLSSTPLTFPFFVIQFANSPGSSSA